MGKVNTDCMEQELRDVVFNWCNDHQEYELARRLAFVPDDVLEKILFESVENVDKILAENGF